MDSVKGLVSLGAMSAPASWQLESEARLLAPLTPNMKATLAVKAPDYRSRANIRVVRRLADTSSAEEAALQFLQSFGAEVRGFKLLESSSVTFSDGVAAPCRVVRFEPWPGMASAQAHIFRIDNGMITHICASVAENDRQRLEAELLPIALTFRTAE